MLRIVVLGLGLVWSALGVVGLYLAAGEIRRADFWGDVVMGFLLLITGCILWLVGFGWSL